MRRVERPRAADVDAARAAIAGSLAPTPLTPPTLAGTAGPGLALKLESLQPTGSFKVRGALNALASLDPGLPVVTASAGNHGLGVAYAAARLGRAATVVVPETASPAKTEALAKYPVTLVRAGGCYDEAEAHALALGGYYLSPYNDPMVIAGQGTIGCELDEQAGGEMTVVCAVGGGGLAAGLGLWASRRPGTTIVGVEAAASTAVSAAVQAGAVVPVEVDATLADGLSGNLEPGSVTVGLVRDHVAALVTVTEDEIAAAIRYLATARGVVAEGAGAAATAAVLAGKVPAANQVIAVVSGRNIAPGALAAILGLSRRISQDRVPIMRLATIRTSDGTTAARLEDQTLIPLAAKSVSELLETGVDSVHDRAGASPVPVPEADFAPVVPRPGKIICVGLNYRMHITETGRETPEYPTIFTKYPDALLGPGDDLVIPSVSSRVDWEVELGVIVGKPIRRASAEEATAAIAGYTVTNDVSMRDWQRRTLQWWAGKNFERSTPVGPYLVTPDEVDYANDLEVRTEVDGEIQQQSRTSDMLFSPGQILAYASQIVTLRPGDIILSGTPGGVGDARQPPVYLAPGNVMRTYIEGLGECVNTCVAEK